MDEAVCISQSANAFRKVYVQLLILHFWVTSRVDCALLLYIGKKNNTHTVQKYNLLFFFSFYKPKYTKW